MVPDYFSKQLCWCRTGGLGLHIAHCACMVRRNPVRPPAPRAWTVCPLACSLAAVAFAVRPACCLLALCWPDPPCKLHPLSLFGTISVRKHWYLAAKQRYTHPGIATYRKTASLLGLAAASSHYRWHAGILAHLRFCPTAWYMHLQLNGETTFNASFTERTWSPCPPSLPKVAKCGSVAGPCNMQCRRLFYPKSVIAICMLRAGMYPHDV
jgi:hypothetical protein